MPEFISKLQHKYYEKGEYTDEKARDLNETIELIKSFPWDNERGSDVQLTGPSITIKDEYGNYLKVALFFNGKYCLYYLDSDGHLYEYHTSELDEACNIVTQFFDGRVPLQSFEKHLFSSGAKSHFETRSFEYRINRTTAFFTILFWAVFSTVYLAFSIVCCFTSGPMRVVGIFSLLFCVLLCQRLYFTFWMYLKAKNMFINIRSGGESFTCGTDDDFKTYHKKDVASLTVYGGGRSSRLVGISEIVFADNSALVVPEMLIGRYDLIAKFCDIKIDYAKGYFAVHKAIKRFIAK